jgi:hypothetical protein
MSLVDLILSVLDATFTTELKNAMNQAAIVMITHPTVPAVGQAPTGLQLADRQGDRLPHKQVLYVDHRFFSDAM